MIADYFFLIWVLGISVPLYWLIPAGLQAVRFGFLSLISICILWTLSPVIMLSIVFFALVLLGFTLAQRAELSPKHLRLLSWFIFSPLVLIEFIPAAWLVSGMLGQSAAQAPLLIGFTYLGISYTAIRCFIMVREHFEGKGPTPVEALTAFVFFGHFVAGPISGAQPWQNVSRSLSGRDVIIAICRIFWGGALFFVIQDYILNNNLIGRLGIPEGHVAAEWLGVYQGFLGLFVNFAGYTEVAIGAALLYGVRLPENFNWPLRATSIQEFWQRWHLSLGKFINTYLFRAVVREVGKPSLAIFLAFTVVGLWHSLSIPYLIWGLGHGAALAVNMMIRKRYPIQKRSALVNRGMMGFGWFFTMTYVSLLSAFANEPTLAAAFDLLKGLI